MDKTILVSLTDADLANGVGSDMRWCPIALALKRATGASHVVVERLLCFWELNGRAYQADMPKQAGGFVGRFDAYKMGIFKIRGGDWPLNPFAFELEPRPDPEHQALIHCQQLAKLNDETTNS
jgi:hypothetical protein